MRLFKGLDRNQGVALAVISAGLLAVVLIFGRTSEDDAAKLGGTGRSSTDVACGSPTDNTMLVGRSSRSGLVVDSKLDGPNLVLVVDRARLALLDYATVKGVARAHYCALTAQDVWLRGVEFRSSPSGDAISRFSSSDLR